MKNKVKKILLLGICLFSCTVYGQGPGNLFSNVYVHGNKNIVRYSPGDNAFINASKKNPPIGYHFTLTDLSTMIDAYFQKDFEVRDMEIYGDKVFFCGQDLVAVSGFIGWFDIYSLFHGSGDVHIDNTLSAKGLMSLDNIEVFTDQGGGIHIAGYGVHSVSPDPYNPLPYNFVYTRYRAFEAVGNPTTGMQYRVADLYSGGLKSDIKDIAVTDNYVVYLQCCRNKFCEPFTGVNVDLEVFPKYNMFSATHFTLGQFETTTSHQVNHYVNGHYCSYIVPDNSDPYSSEAKMVHIGQDKVAVCSYRADVDYPGWIPFYDCQPYPYDYCIPVLFYCENQWYLANRVYDISPVLTNNPIVMVSADVAQLPPVLDVIEDFVYDSQRKSYVVVHRHERIPGYMETAFTTMDYSSGMPTNVFSDYEIMVGTFSGWRPTSVCLFGNGEYLISGEEQSSHDQLFWKSKINFEVGGCDLNEQYPMTSIPTMEAKNNTWEMIASGWVTLDFIEYFPDEKKEKEIMIKCN